MITVKKLIEVLKQMPQDLPIIVQSDAEGNSYKKCMGADDNTYTYDIDDYSLDIRTSQDIIDYGDRLEDFIQVVVIYPE